MQMEISIHASTWEATVLATHTGKAILQFQFTPLHERQPKALWLILNRCLYFNSRLYMRGNSYLQYHVVIYCIFQFTPLHERQQGCSESSAGCRKISIHASTWEATKSVLSLFFWNRYFNSRLYMRGNVIKRFNYFNPPYFNSRLYMRGNSCVTV